MIVLRYLYVVALIVWVGGLVAAGAMVAPALFAVLPAEAGAAAGRALAGAAFGEVLRRLLTTGEAAEGLRRDLALPSSVTTADPRRARFDALHSLSTTLVMATALAGLVVAVWEARE